MFKYQNLIDLLPVESVESTIKEMVNNIDMTGKCYVNDPFSNEEETFMRYFSPSENFIKLMEETAQKEYDEDVIKEFSFFKLPPEREIEIKKGEIYKNILDYFASDAKKIANNREYLRVKIGDFVDFNDCSLSYKLLGKVEFYKDGGWGIAEEDGKVIVKNHLMVQPSRTLPLVSNRNCPYSIIQDRDTKRYGVLSYVSFHEMIHCNYDKIEVVEYYNLNDKHYFIKVSKNGKYGCFDENCALLIECKYDEIIQKSGYFECLRDGEYLLFDKTGGGYDSIFEGKKDLYNNEGSLLIGGYSNLEMEFGYFKFYFGTTYEYYYVEETDFYDQTYKLSKLRLNYQNSVCLVLDESFRSVIRNKDTQYMLTKGTIFNSIEEVKIIVPSCCLLKFQVNLSDINDNFIYLIDFYGIDFIVPTYIVKGFHDPEEQGLFEERIQKEHIEYFSELRKKQGLKENEPINVSEFLLFDEHEIPRIIYEDYSYDIYFENPMITIIKLTNQKEIEWVDYANEIDTTENYKHIYRKGSKFGFFDKNGLKPACYDAISKNSPDHKIYVASYEYNCVPNPINLNNPNYFHWNHMFVHYFVINEEVNHIRVEDDWKIFNPVNCKWFPYDFITNNYGDSDDGISTNWHDRGNEWTDEDAWDAMTDGMYGDYPGSGWDSEKMGF